MRKVWLLNILLLVAVAIAGSRFWSFWREPLPGLPQTVSAPLAPSAPSATNGPTEAGEGAATTQQTYDEIVARDLFSPARGVIPPAPRTPVESKPVPRPPPPPKVTLYGVVILDTEKSAFLQEGTAEVKPRRVREGEAFAGGKLTAIRPDGVTILFAGGEVTVPLRTPKETIAAPGARPAEGAAPTPTAPEAFPRQMRQPAGRVPANVREPGQGVPPRQAPPRFVPAPPIEEIAPEEELFPEEEGAGEEMIDEGEGGEFIEEESPEL